LGFEGVEMSELTQDLAGAYNRLVDAITGLVKSDDEVVSAEDKDYVRAKPVVLRKKTKKQAVKDLLASGEEWTIWGLNSAASTTSSKDYIYQLRREGMAIRDRWAKHHTHKIFWVKK